MAATTTTKPRTRKAPTPKVPQDHLPTQPKALRRIPIDQRIHDLFTAVGTDSEGKEVEKVVQVKLPRSGLTLANRAVALLDQLGDLESAAKDPSKVDLKVILEAYAGMRLFIKGVLVGTDAETEEVIDALDEESLVWVLEQIINLSVGTATEALPNS